MALRAQGPEKTNKALLQDTLDPSQPSDLLSWELHHECHCTRIASPSNATSRPLLVESYSHSYVPAVDNFIQAIYGEWFWTLDSALQSFSLWAITQPRVSLLLLLRTNALHSFFGICVKLVLLLSSR